MEDRHATEISSGLNAVASAIRTLAFIIGMGAVYIGCQLIMMHH